MRKGSAIPKRQSVWRATLHQAAQMLEDVVMMTLAEPNGPWEHLVSSDVCSHVSGRLSMPSLACHHPRRPAPHVFETQLSLAFTSMALLCQFIMALHQCVGSRSLHTVPQCHPPRDLSAMFHLAIVLLQQLE
eukprot:jgi/Ulvmu1/1070/UM105_0029.1